MQVIINNFLKYVPLLMQLVGRDLRVKYRRSILGYLWSLLNPLMMMVVVSFVFSHIFKNDIDNFPIYLIIGQTLWSFHAEATNTAMKSVIHGGSLLKKVYVPKYIFPLAKVLSAFVNLLFSLIAVVLVLIITRTPVTPIILMFPVPLIYLMIFSTGIGMLVCVFAVYFRDMEHLYSVFLLAWMYLTPIFYPANRLPEQITALLRLNPMYHYIQFMRSLVLYGEMPSLYDNLVCLAFSLGALAIGLFVFHKKQDGFILRI